MLSHNVSTKTIMQLFSFQFGLNDETDISEK